VKETIIFELEEGDDPKDYADPIAALCVVKDIVDLMRGLDKWGSDYKTVGEAISGIRANILALCSELGEEWRC
jgi:hypothetical protein